MSPAEVRAPYRAVARRAAGAAAAAVLALGAAGCTGAPDRPPVPDGFTRASTGPVSVTHPEDWTTRKPEGGADLTVTDADTATARLDILENVTFAPIPQHALSMTQGGRESEWRDYRQERSEITVAGAEHAWEVDFSYTARDGGVVEGVDLILVGPDGMAHQVKVTWSPGALGPEAVESITETVEVAEQ